MSLSNAGKGFFNSSVYKMEVEPINEPEQKLWRAVLARVLEDAFGKSVSTKVNYEKRFARDYLKTMHKDFAQLCEWAGFDADYVHLKVKKRFGKEFMDNLNNLSLQVRGNNEENNQKA